MTYTTTQTKKSQFTTDDTISNSSTFDFVKAGINKKTSWSNIKARLAEVFGLSVRLYETESAMVADTDLELGDHAIVEENRYALYEMTNVAAVQGDVTLSNGLIATQQGKMIASEFEDYDEIRGLKSSIFMEGEVLTVTNDGIGGDFNFRSGTVTDSGGTLIVFNDDSNRYVERVYNGRKSVKWFGATGDGVTDDTSATQQWLDSGGDLYAPSGTYITSATLLFASNSVIRGAGVDSTTFKAIDDSLTHVFATTRRSGGTALDGQKENIFLSDITVDGNTPTPTSDEDAIRFSWFSNCHVKDIRVVNTKGAGLRFDGYGDQFEDAAYLDSDGLTVDPLATTSSSNVVTVTHSRHGLNSGGLVTISGAASTNGIPGGELNTEHSITVVDDNSYTVTVTTMATSSGSGGGSSVIASNPRHSTRWSQSSNFSAEKITIDNSYLGVELEGGVYSGYIEGVRCDRVSLYYVRVPSAENVSCRDIRGTGGRSLFWIDRAKRIHCRDSTAFSLSRNGLALGICSDSSFKDIRVELEDTSTYAAVSDSFQRTAGIQRCSIKEITSNTARIELLAGSEDCIIKDSQCKIDVLRSGNSNIICEDNIGSLTRNSSLDLNSERFGGTAAKIVRAIDSTGAQDRNSLLGGLSIRAMVAFNGSASTITDSYNMAASPLTRNGVGDYSLTLADTINNHIVAIGACRSPGKIVVKGSQSGSTINISVQDNSGVLVDSIEVDVLFLGY